MEREIGREGEREKERGQQCQHATHGSEQMSKSPCPDFHGTFQPSQQKKENVIPSSEAN